MEALRLERLTPYLPRVVHRHLCTLPDALVQEVDGTLVFLDVSGFTQLSERLARRGREGAEDLADAIGTSFALLLEVAYENGGSLLKFGGDALLLLFEGADHAVRGARAAIGMRRALREAGAVEAGGVGIRLRMSAGVHSGVIQLFLVGGSHRELLVTGPAATEVVRMEGSAQTGQIVMSAAAAARLPASCAEPSEGPGVLLARAPGGQPTAPEEPFWTPPADAIAGCLSTALRAHLAGGPLSPEHRSVTIAFLHFDGTDALVASDPAAAGQALEALMRRVQAAADAHGVALLGSDVDADGGKLLLTAGAPTGTGDDEARMLVAMRQVLDGDVPVPVRIGVNRGPVFAGDIGPAYRRTYTVMGDAVNLAARVMAKAPPGELYATAAVLGRSSTAFAAEEIPPFHVKGKAGAVVASSVGRPLGRPRPPRGVGRLPLVGRDAELATLTSALAAVLDGDGRLVDLAGDTGMGKTRLVEALRECSGRVRRAQVTCDPYTASVPYFVWRDLLRDVLDLAADAPVDVVIARVQEVAAADPELAPWLPLLATPLDVPLAPTTATERLSPEHRAARLQDTVAGLLRRVVRAPMLVEVEDAHQLDHASAELFASLSGRLAGVPLLILLVRRADLGAIDLAELSGVVRVELAPLGPDAALALAEAATEQEPLPPALLRVAARRSGGNPQFLRDLLRAAMEGDGRLPDSIEAAATARIDRLAPADRTLVRRAAVLGSSFDPRLLPEVLDADVPVPDDAAWTRLDSYFEREPHGNVRFRRAVVREVAYAGLPFRLRRALHARVGARLERDLGWSSDAEAAVLSVHFLLGADHARAWRYARVAGDRATAESAPVDAARLYRRAIEAAAHLEVAPDELAAVWEALGEANHRFGALDAAGASFTAARRLTAGNPVREGRLLHRHALVALDAGRIRPAVRWVMRGLRTLEPVTGPDAGAYRAQLVATLATARQREGNTAAAVAAARRAVGEAEAAGDDNALAAALIVLDNALVESGQAASQYAERALELYTALGDLDRQGAALSNLGAYAYWEGRWADAIELYRRGAQASAEAGDSSNAAVGDYNVAEVLSDLGRLDEASALLRRARQVWSGTGNEWAVASATALLGRAAARAGRHAEALEHLTDAVESFGRLGVAGLAAWAEALRAEALAFAGEAADALELADRLLLDVAGTGRTGPLLHRVRGFALAALGDTAAAEGALGAALAEARLQDEIYEIGLSLDALIAFAAATGLPAEWDPGERDAIFTRLGVVTPPPIPLAPAGTAAGAG